MKIPDQVIVLEAIKYNIRFTTDQVFKILKQGIILIPDDQLQFKPNEKSQNISYLVTHIFNMLYLYTKGVVEGHFNWKDFESLPIRPHHIKNTNEIIEYANVVEAYIRNQVDYFEVEDLNKHIVFDFQRHQ